MMKRKMKIALITACAGALVATASLGIGAVQTIKADAADNNMIMKAGASARLFGTDNENGIRYTTILDKTWYDELSYQTIEIGTLIVPTDLITEGELIDNENANKVIYISETVNNNLIVDGDTYTYTGSITTIKDGNLMRPFTGVGYVLVNEGLETEDVYYATQTDNSRSIMYVLSGYLAEGKTDYATYANEKIATAIERIDANVANAGLTVTIDDTTYMGGETLSVSQVGGFALSANYGGFAVIPTVSLETSSRTLKATLSADLTELNIEGIGEGELTFTVGEKTMTLSLACDDYSQYAIMHEGNKAAFGFVEKWNGALSGISDLTVETSIVDQMANGASGTYTKNVVTFNATGNAKFKISPTSYPKGSYEDYQALAADDPNLGVKFYLYMDGSSVKHTNGNITALTNGVTSAMFGITSHTPTASSGVYTITHVMSLTEWLALNYTQNSDDASKMDFSWENILTFGGQNTIGTGSTLTCYVAIDLVDMDRVISAENISVSYGNWGTSAENYTVTSENVTEVNGTTGNYVKYNFVQSKSGNNLITLKNTPIHSYSYLSGLAAANADLNITLNVYVDGTGITKSSTYLTNSIKSAAFGDSEATTLEKNKSYTVQKTMTLSAWLALNYDADTGTWNNNALFAFSGTDSINVNDNFAIYISISIA